MISSHTFELRKEFDSETFKKWHNRAKHKKHFNDDLQKDFSYVKEGITVWYHKTKHRRLIKLIINPSTALGLDDVIELWKPKKKNIAKVLRILEDFMDDYFDSKYTVKDFMLTRIDFTKNVYLKDRKKVSAYINFFHNIRKVKGFSPKYKKSDEWYNSDSGFDLQGNSNGIGFTVYDREFAMMQLESKKRVEMAKGILRFEVKLTTQKAIRNYTKEEDTVLRMYDLFPSSEKIFLDTFVVIVPYGDIYKKDKALEIIKSNVADKKIKSKMLKLLELVPKKKSLHLAINEMNDRNIVHVLNKFRCLNLSPVTISKRQEIKHLENLYGFFYLEINPQLTK